MNFNRQMVPLTCSRRESRVQHSPYGVRWLATALLRRGSPRLLWVAPGSRAVCVPDSVVRPGHIGFAAGPAHSAQLPGVSAPASVKTVGISKKSTRTKASLDLCGTANPGCALPKYARANCTQQESDRKRLRALRPCSVSSVLRFSSCSPHSLFRGAL
jgi:hypothetical protein